MALLLVVVAGIVLLCVAAIAWLTAERVTDQAAQNALGIARTLAADPELRAEVDRQAQLRTLDVAELATGPIQRSVEAVRLRTGALFVVVTEDRGLRLAHPNPQEIGRRVSTEPVALRGSEQVARERGTLGESVRAKVPVFAPGSTRVVGEVSTGVAVSAVRADIRQALETIIAVGALALLLGLLAAIYLRRLLHRLTLGLEPEEMTALARDQAAVLYGVDDGVIGLDPGGRITVRNKAARTILDLAHRNEPGDIVGMPFADAGLPVELVELISRARYQGAEAGPLRLVLAGTVALASVIPVRRAGTDLGAVVMLRDTTTLETLGRRLDDVQSTAAVLRAQRHEFANRLHTVSGLLANGDIGHARDYIGEVIASGPVREPVENLTLVADPYLRAFLGAKGVQAHELDVVLRVGEDTAVFGLVSDAQDVTAVLGNLLDNALAAAVEGASTDRWVEVDLLTEGADLHIVVADSGSGVDPALAGRIFEDGVSSRPSSDEHVHGHGLGLPLVRRLARRRGGDVWMAEVGPGSGAVFCARLPGVITPEPRGGQWNQRNQGKGNGI